MVEDFVKEYAKKIANNPEAIEIKLENLEDNTCAVSYTHLTLPTT